MCKINEMLFVAVLSVSLTVLAGCVLQNTTVGPMWSWESLGYVSTESAGEPWNATLGTSIAVGTDGLVVVAFCEAGAISVKKYSAESAWTDFGSPGTGGFLSMTIDPSDNKPIVAFDDGNTGCQVVKWSSGTSWTSLGSPGAGGTYLTSVAIDPVDNKPVVACAVHDRYSSGYLLVKKWSNDTNWDYLGCPCSSSCTSVRLAVGKDGAPIVAFNVTNVFNDEYETHVSKYLDQGWMHLYGLPIFGEGPVLAIDPSDDMPLVISGNGVYNLYKWSGESSWTNMGTPVPSTGRGCNLSLVLQPGDLSPVVSFVDRIHGNRACVSKWSGGLDWTDMGHPGAGEVCQLSLAIDPTGRPIVIFGDGSDGWRAHVMRGQLE